MNRNHAFFPVRDRGIFFSKYFQSCNKSGSYQPRLNGTALGKYIDFNLFCMGLAVLAAFVLFEDLKFLEFFHDLSEFTMTKV